MKSILTIPAFLLLLFSSVYLHAQITTASQWAWMKGDSTVNAAGVYGTQGVAADSTKPGARGGGSASWKDASGNLWLFGGNYSSGFINGWLNDLWKYSTATNQWTWVKGSNTVGQYGVYGTKGTPAASNAPGGRNESVTWMDTAGNFWLFGGYGYPASFIAGQFINLNDLWKYNPATNEWTWISGSNAANMQGVYGTQGVAAATNTPGARVNSFSWTDAAGKFWLFGGRYDSSNGSRFLNDLWKYDPATNLWTWMKGANTANQSGIYGTTGVPAPTNTPGARSGGYTWIDGAGNLWLFGGEPTSGNFFNDIWKYNPATNEWTCVSGTNTTDQFGIYGTLGVSAASNKPGARGGGVSWTDATSNVYLFGGYGNAATTIGYLNDLWRYNPATNQWTWIKGANTAGQQGIYNTQGTAGSGNRPGSRVPAASWVDGVGNCWLFGGAGGGYRNDLWKINSINVNNVANNASQWIWMKGDSTTAKFGIYGTKGTAMAPNKPGARTGSAGFTDGAGNYWLFGGNGYAAGSTGSVNDFWKYTPANNQWAWISGDSVTNNLAVYGTKGVAAASNKPGGRENSATWTDAAGNFWVFGGYGYAGNSSSVGRGVLNDLWKYNPSTNQWTWVNGDTAKNRIGIYGTKGAPAATNQPGARHLSVTWIDAAGNLWLFGGAGWPGDNSSESTSSLNDLWKYNPSTNQWTWMNGANTGDPSATYGTLGMPAAANTPGGTGGCSSWKDTAGNLWLFGGFGFYNHLWKYNPVSNQWAWINGANTLHQPGVYGTQGVAAPANTPGGRYDGSEWTDVAGNFWLFGGLGYATNNNVEGRLNDLWKYDLPANQWIWVKGDSTKNQSGIYGSVETAGVANKPGARSSGVTWADASGNFWLFGGFGYASNSYSWLNDFWKLRSATVAVVSVNNGNWNDASTWLGGNVPTADVIVRVKHVVTVQANASCYSLTVEGPNGNVTVKTGVQFIVLH